ncbi:MAG: hypothetical protein WAW23_13335 [Candidatus Methanoperedens sp.]
MRIDKIEVMPVKDSINPELLFEIEFFIQRRDEIPIEISGGIFSDDNKKIANIHEVIHDPNRRIELSARNDERYEEEKSVIKLLASLNHKVLDYIETLRTKNLKGDVILNLDIFVKTLNSRTNISNLNLFEMKGAQGFPEGSKGVYYRYQSKFSTSQTNMWILSGDGSPTFIEIKNNNFKNKVVIRSSDWIHDYCPVFQIGKFSVFEYLLPDYAEGSGSIEERLNESINAIKRMEENMIKGDWNGVIEDSRAVWELLRNQDEIKDLLMRDGYSEQAFIDLNESLRQLFNFSSKFHHKEDKGKKIMPEIKASKEDAYLIYAMSMNIVNLISKKMQRLQS